MESELTLQFLADLLMFHEKSHLVRLKTLGLIYMASSSGSGGKSPKKLREVVNSSKVGKVSILRLTDRALNCFKKLIFFVAVCIEAKYVYAVVKENIEHNARLIGKLRMVNISLIFVPPECLGKRKYSELIMVVKIIFQVKIFDPTRLSLSFLLSFSPYS